MDDGSSEPYNVFPKHGNRNVALSFLGIFLLSSIVIAWVHSKFEPRIKKLRSYTSYVSLYFVFYVVPAILILGAIQLRSAGQDTGTVVFLVVSSAMWEIGVASILFSSDKSDAMMRIGLRVLFLACCVLLGAAATQSLLDQTDYYGPVRVTNLDVDMFRPEQTVSVSNPKWYYYYTGVQQLQWGHSWGCPPEEADTWCNTTQQIIDGCSQKVNCQGKSYHATNFSACVDDITEVLLLTKVINCMDNKYSNVTISSDFDKDVPPWLDPNNTYWRTYPTNCGDCTVLEDASSPGVHKSASLVETIIGIAMIVCGAVLAIVGHKRQGKPDIPASTSADVEMNSMMVPG